MGRPHPALIELAAGRPVPPVDDPEGLLVSAREHRMYGLLWEEIRSGKTSLSVDVERTLAKWHLLLQVRHRRLWESLERTVSVLREIEVEVASAKGVTAELRWYPGPATRPSQDIDLLLRPSDIHRVEEVVATLHPGHRLQVHIADLARSGQLQSIDLRDEAGTHIDLHFDILKWEVDTRQNRLIWDRSETMNTDSGTELVVLDPETSLILFLLHLNKDRFSYLLGFADVARLLRSEDLDWGFVDYLLRVEGFEAHLYLALDTVMRTLGLPVPEHPSVTGWRSTAWRRLWPEQVRLGGDLGLARHHRRQYWIGLTARGRWLEATQRGVRRIFPARSLLDYYHPGLAGPYLWHLVRGRTRAGRQRRAAARLAERPGESVAESRLRE